MKLRTPILASLLAVVPSTAGAADILETLDERLRWTSPEGTIRSKLGGALDLEGYWVDEVPPGLVFGDDDRFFNPRLTLTLEAEVGKRFYTMLQARFDRGFDPGSRPAGDARLDEYLVRYKPFDHPGLNLQAGKFATVFGNWVQRHDSWSNPFINAPMVYENVTIQADHLVPPNADRFLSRRNRTDLKEIWVPVIWGPSYATGGSVFGRIGDLEYAFEIKNASLSSRPYAWDLANQGFDAPTFTGRLGYHPSTEWLVGVSASQGGYFVEEVERDLPAGSRLRDYQQTSVGMDASYAWHSLQIWGEAVASQFEVPNVGDTQTLGYFLETKYKFSARWFGALRWNQQFFDDIPNGLGGERAWDSDAWRAEAAIGYRHSRHIQTKLQYSIGKDNGPVDQGEHMVAAQVTFRF